MAKPILPDELWNLIEPLLPPPKPRRRRYPGRKPVDNRRVLTGILFVLSSGIPWEALPQELGCYCGMTVYYVTKLSPERVVNIITRFGTDRMIVNGSADWGHSDPLAVPKTAIQMRKSGLFVEEDINKVFFENPFSFLKASPKFTLMK